MPPFASLSSRGFKPVGQVLARSLRSRQAPQRLDDARQAIRAYVTDLARELGDEARLSVSVSRVYNLYRRSGRDLGAFIAVVLEARSRLQEYTKKIKKRRKATGTGSQINQFPYYLAIVEDLLGLRPTDKSSGQREAEV
jgi:hypothetical protein